MVYQAPLADMRSAMLLAGGLAQGQANGLYADADDDTIEAVLAEAARFAEQRLAPLNRVGDRTGATLRDGDVTTPPGWREAYRDWAAGGWLALAAPESEGGQGLPLLLQAACTEMWNAANMAFALNPLLSVGAIEALVAHGSADLKARYLRKLMEGTWTGTMNLTEPQAGSDLAALRTRAEPMGDGRYRITGQKIYITYGEHDLADNIIHLVLARLPDAPAGTRGISLFLVPKVLPDGTRNDVRCAGLEHKLGIHASPTCTMVYGDKGGAIGWLVGEENRGLACMFTMMNNARLGVALQGVAVADRATQQALRYAKDRRQGRAPGSRATGMSAIIEHPDVKRMLLDMRTKTLAARAICYATAGALDRAHRAPTEAERRSAADEAALLTPVAKGFATDIAIDVASTGVQVHGGMGFVEETGAAQHYRDARILAIYEGTNGIQAIDLVARKLPLGDGAAANAAVTRVRAAADAVRCSNDPAFGTTAERLAAAGDSLARATAWMREAMATRPAEALAGASPYARLFGLAYGGALLAEIALSEGQAPGGGERIRDARFFAETSVAIAAGIESCVIDGGAAVVGAFVDEAA